MSKSLADSKERIDVLEKEGQKYCDEIKNLKEIQKQTGTPDAVMIARGCEIITRIENNNLPASDWRDTKDFTYAVMYYMSKNPSLIDTIATEYDRLTDFEIFFYIIDKSLKKNDDEIHGILNIALSTVRSRRSKIKAKKKIDNLKYRRHRNQTEKIIITIFISSTQ